MYMIGGIFETTSVIPIIWSLSKAFWFIIFFYNLFCLYRIKSRVIFSRNIILYLILNACSSPWKAECKTMCFLYPVECNNKWTNVFLKCHSACSLKICEINNNALFVPKRLWCHHQMMLHLGTQSVINLDLLYFFLWWV